MYTCAVCGKALGMYEPLVWVRSDTVVEGSLTTLKGGAALDPATARLLHAECAGRSARRPLAGVAAGQPGLAKYPQGESNPRYGRERPAC
jgi:hypothetical protein